MKESNHNDVAGPDGENLDPELVSLYKAHEKLEKMIDSIAQHAKYSTSAAMRQRELKKRKLHQWDKIVSSLNGK